MCGALICIFTGASTVFTKLNHLMALLQNQCNDFDMKYLCAVAVSDSVESLSSI